MFCGEKMFEKISMFGCLAYCICCFENYILSLNYDKSEWKIVFDKLWSMDSMEHFDDWVYQAIELKPECILEYSYYNSPSEWEYIDEATFHNLYSLYRRCTKLNEINDFFNVILSGIELYTSSSLTAHSFREHMDEVFIPSITTLSIELPDIYLFYKFSDNKLNGWGVPVSRDMIEKPYEFA